MTVSQKIVILLVCLLPFFSKAQDFITFMVHPYHVDSISKAYAEHPHLSAYLSLDSTTLQIWVYADNCTGPEIVADRITFSFAYSSHSAKKDTSITIKPDTITSFKSYLFAYMVYEGAELFKTPRKSKNRLHRVAETDTYDSLVFYDQFIDKKGQMWYNVKIKGNRYLYNCDTELIEEKPFEVGGWMLKGRTRLVFYGFQCD